MTTQDDIVSYAKANHHLLGAAGQLRAENNIRLHQVVVFVKDTVDAMITDALTERVSHYMVPAHVLNGVEVVSATVLPTSALTANDTNFATITLSKNDGAGGARTAFATLLTNVAGGNWVAFSNKAMTVNTTLATRTIAVGGQVTVTVEKAAAGIQTGILTIVMVVKEL